MGSVVASNSLSQSSGQAATIQPSRFNFSFLSSVNGHTSSLLSPHEVHQEERKSGTHCDISTLQIDPNKSKFELPDSKNFDTLSIASGAFSLKRYDVANNSGIDFGDMSSNQRCRKGPLVKPPKFNAGNSSRRGAAKSSWVAGGYWLNNKYQQNKINSNRIARNYDLPENLSRSSSQSSGFVSYSGQPVIPRNTNVFDLKSNQMRSKLNTTINSNLANDSIESCLGNEGKTKNDVTKSLYNMEKNHSNSIFSLNPISDQLAFFDTSSTKLGYSRPSSPIFYSKDSQPNDFLSPSRNCSRMSQNFTTLKSNDKELDNLSLNSSLDRLTQEAFSELQPKAESSPNTLFSNKCNNNVLQKPWMDKKITINISFYSIILFLSVAANLALIIYFMS